MPPETGNGIFVHQIFYDQASRDGLDPGFIPLDNSVNARPDWYEFWVIRNFLRNNSLKEGAWYGFLSPRFTQKSGFTSGAVIGALQKYDARADVALFSVGWDQLAYFLNPFEQGEIWHPGLSRAAQSFFDEIGLGVDLSRLVTYAKTSVFSNYIIAKPGFWAEWLAIADRFFDRVESGALPGLGGTTSYGSALNQAPMKTFIQERFASVILARGRYRAIVADQSQHAPIFTRLFRDGPQTRRMLQACDLLKEKYCLTQDNDYLDMYYKIRKDIEFTRPGM
ncbi:MAG: hypothetical protein IT489_11025 [Gammaproteobacteria bacterium]|nr:hypothetical protein [Gammaproteobacteria bacterium]